MVLLRTSDMVVLGIADSPELVTVYALTRYVPEAVVTLVAMVVMRVAPGLGGIIGSGNSKKGATVRRELMTFTWLLAVITGVGILLWNRSFVGIWVGDTFFAGRLANLLIVLLVVQFVFIRNDSHIIDLTLDLKNKVLLGALAGTVSVVVSTILVLLDHGIVGLCIGFLVGRGIVSLAYPAVVGGALGIRLRDQARQAIRPALVTMLLFTAATLSGPHLIVDSWLLLIGGAATTVLVVTPIAFFLGLDPDGRARISSRAERLMATFGSNRGK